MRVRGKLASGWKPSVWRPHLFGSHAASVPGRAALVEGAGVGAWSSLNRSEGRHLGLKPRRATGERCRGPTSVGKASVLQLVKPAKKAVVCQGTRKEQEHFLEFVFPACWLVAAGGRAWSPAGGDGGL